MCCSYKTSDRFFSLLIFLAGYFCQCAPTIGLGAKFWMLSSHLYTRWTQSAVHPTWSGETPEFIPNSTRGGEFMESVPWLRFRKLQNSLQFFLVPDAAAITPYLRAKSLEACVEGLQNSAHICTCVISVMCSNFSRLQCTLLRRLL